MPVSKASGKATGKAAGAGRGGRTSEAVASLLDLLGHRWLLRVLWELRAETLTFRELRERCDAMSPTVLNQRLRELREAGIVTLEEPAGYVLTKYGRQLLETLQPLQRWAEQWQRRMKV
jgi:DNA-binding HxlR family transcriptional regulator